MFEPHYVCPRGTSEASLNLDSRREDVKRKFVIPVFVFLMIILSAQLCAEPTEDMRLIAPLPTPITQSK